MEDIFQGAYCSESSGNTCAPIQYASGSPLVGEFSGLAVLTVALWVAPSPTTVLGYSQGSLISTEWLRTNAGKFGAPSPRKVSFVLVANPLRKYGGVRPAIEADSPTPNTGYEVLDIAIEYDGVADFPDNPFNLLAVANALMGMNYVHIYAYDDVDLQNSAKLVWKEGNTTYVLIRNENLPLLEPMRELGLDAMADSLNRPLKWIIDSAYNRKYPGLVAPDGHAAALQEVSPFSTGLTDAAPVVAAASSEAAHWSARTSAPAARSDSGAQEGAAGPQDVESPLPGEPAVEDADESMSDVNDQQSAETESEPPAAEAGVVEKIDIESDVDTQHGGATPDAESASNSESSSASHSEETKPQRGEESSGPASGSAASGSGSQSEASSE